MSEYDKQANDFLEKTGTTFKAKFLKNGLHFPSDTEARDIYKITLTKGERVFAFNFGQSIDKSGSGEEKPTAYDILAGLTKNEVGDLKEFCDSFGYDEDSKTAEKTYNAVLNEWNNVKMLWTDEEIKILQEIQ